MRDCLEKVKKKMIAEKARKRVKLGKNLKKKWMLMKKKSLRRL